MATVGNVWVYQARYRVPVARATAGNLVLIEGVDGTITRTATLVADAYDEPVHIFRYRFVAARWVRTNNEQGLAYVVCSWRWLVFHGPGAGCQPAALRLQSDGRVTRRLINVIFFK